MSEHEPTESGLEDLGHEFIRCISCGSEHIDIWKTKESNRITTIKVVCENEGCGGSSPTREIVGEFYIGCTESSQLVSIDQDTEDYVEIHAKSTEV